MVSDAYIPCRKLFIDTINIFLLLLNTYTEEVIEHLGLTRSVSVHEQIE
jgi:hypothetical protein